MERAPSGEGYVTVRPEEPGSDRFAAALAVLTPAAEWEDRVRDIAGRLGEDRLAGQVARWLSAACRSRPGLLNRPGRSRDALHGLMWMARSLAAVDAGPIVALQSLVAYCVEKRAWQATPGCCILALIPRVEALGALYQLVERTKRPAPKLRHQRLGRHLARRLGVSEDDAAELFVPDHGFSADGRRELTVEGYTAALTIDGSHVRTAYRNADGREVRTLPAAVKARHRAELSALATAGKEAQKTLIAQRDRIDALPLSGRSWTVEQFAARYLRPALVGALAHRLIWSVDGQPALFVDGRWTDVAGQPVPAAEDAPIKLWHPITAPPDEVPRWRRRLEDLCMTQPFKQAHRELYVLTDAERTTHTYSNRFAAHVLRQAQFRVLATGRQWTAPYLGGWDAGDRGRCERRLPGEWRAEFWVTGTADQFLHSGGYAYLTTDQVRFYGGDDRQPLPLDQVPPLVFSEIMRDVDLFVGVASVGNDPTWQDGGPGGRYRTYWHDYSFGELTSETAKTRRDVIARLLPRLTKINDRCAIEDRFLVVCGSLRTYKIHLGSGNILMEPNDQYLCIVPDRSTFTDGVFLPFEGDATLAVILSKAFLLADDAKIKDPTITRQIKR
jgi:hypothetical protein